MNSRIRSIRAGRSAQATARPSWYEALSRRWRLLLGTERRQARQVLQRLEGLEPDQRLREVGEW